MDIYILVGTNPLPCYLSALYLLDYYEGQDNTVYLVCSEGSIGKGQGDTFSIAKRIKDLLQEERQDAVVKINKIADISSYTAIESFVEDQVLAQSRGQGVHLNFTGGTKTMSTLIYYHMQKKLGDKLSSSYLDSRIHHMMVYPVVPEYEDLRQRYKISIDGPARLHDITDLRKQEESDFDEAAETMNSLFDEYLTGAELPFFDKGFRKTDLGKYLSPEGGSKISPEEAAECAEALGICEVIGKIPEKYQDVMKKRLEDVSKKGKKPREKAFKFFDGIWFEHYVVDKLREAVRSDDNIDIYFDVSRGGDKFQLDIVIIYGYQLSVVSITTSSQKGIVKQKAFEAIHRARQMGGDETKMVVMSFLKDAQREALKEELELDTGGTFSKYRIFGRKDLGNRDLYSNILDFIKK